MNRVRLTRAFARHLSPIFVAALAFLFLHGGLSNAIAAVPYQEISSAGPLNRIFLGADTSVQIAHVADAATGDFEFFPPDAIPGDAGTFLVVNDVLYAPNFAEHDGTETGALGAYTAFTPISQTAVTGSGTAADPYQVVTVVDAGATGLRITQTDSYIVGQESYRTDVQISNSGAAAQSAILYRAGDCYLAGSDDGYGAVNTATGAVACTVTPNNTPPNRIAQWLPLTGGSSYYEAEFDEVWARIGAHQPFPNTCRCTEAIDNGAGLSWNVSVPAGGQVTYSHLTTFSPTGNLPLTSAKTADNPTSEPGATNRYTITIANPNAENVTLDSITDLLPAGFSYVAGSTTGVTTTDPSISGQTLTWTGPFTAPAGGSVTLSFRVTVATTAGTYVNNASAEAAGGFTVAPTSHTITVTVRGTPQVYIPLVSRGSSVGQ